MKMSAHTTAAAESACTAAEGANVARAAAARTAEDTYRVRAAATEADARPYALAAAKAAFKGEHVKRLLESLRHSAASPTGRQLQTDSET